MSVTFHCLGHSFEIALASRRPALRLRVNGAELALEELVEGPDGRVSARIGGAEIRGWRLVEGDRVHLRLGGRTYRFDHAWPGAGAGEGAGSGDELRATMPGVVVSLGCAAGDKVHEGQALLVIESMKMQLTLAAPRAGTVAAIHVAANATFEKGASLVSLHPLAE